MSINTPRLMAGMMHFGRHAGPITALSPVTDVPHLLGWVSFWEANVEPPPDTSVRQRIALMDVGSLLNANMDLRSLLNQYMDVSPYIHPEIERDAIFQSRRIDADVSDG